MKRSDALQLARNTGNVGLAAALSRPANSLPDVSDAMRHELEQVDRYNAKPARKPRALGTSGKSLELVVANGGGVIEWTRVPNGVKYVRGGDTVPTKSPVDFIGTVIGTGRAVFCDAKRCSQKTGYNAQRDHLKPHQISELVRHGRAGAIAGLLIESTAEGAFYWLGWRDLQQNKASYRWAELRRVGMSNVAINWRLVIAPYEPASAGEGATR